MTPFKRKLRHFWHEIFIRSGPKAIRFGMSCKDVTHHADLHSQPETWQGRLRVALHLTYCQACKNYFHLSRVFRKSIQQQISVRSQSDREKKLNEALIGQFAKPISPKENS